MENASGNTFFKFLIDVLCDKDSTNLFEIFLKSFEVLERSVEDEFCTDYFGMNFDISGTGRVNVEQ